jgi:hypothetical protein
MGAKTAEQHNAAAFDMGAMLKDQITAANNILMSGVTAGAEGVWIKITPSVRALAAAYERAKADEQAKLPTVLAVAIEAVLRDAAHALPASPYTDRRTQRRTDIETSVDGRQIAPGQ